ncbi:MAG: CoA-binding protein [Desulfofustis sp.]|nr:CoA-binding protein [Desulfofustis sp.]
MLAKDNDQRISTLLHSSRVIAVVGLSPKENRPSNQVARYLVEAGYRVIPVNPGHSRILGLGCYPDLDTIPEPVDIVDIFRRSAEVPPIVAQAVAIGAGAVWLQQGIVNEDAARQAEAAGLICVMDRCIKIEHQRLLVGKGR